MTTAPALSSADPRLPRWLFVPLTAWLAAASPAPAQAEEPAPSVAAPPTPLAAQPVSALQADMHQYFRAELRGGLVLVGMGAPAVALGAGLLTHDSALWRGAAYPLLILGGLELVGGLFFAARTPAQVRKLDRGLQTAPLVAQAGELARMRRVNRQFTAIEVFEVVLMAGGLVTAAVASAYKQDTVTGIGLGISAEATGLLLFDIFASRRALRFTESLERPLQRPAQAP